RKFSARGFWNDGRKKKNEGDLVHSETAVEDCGGSGDSGADFIGLALCGAGLSLWLSVGAYQHLLRLLRSVHADCWPSSKRHHRSDTSFSDFPIRIADGCHLAAWQSAGPEICH